MRDIKFRGKRIDNGEWVYGSLLNDFGGDTWIINTLQEIKDATIKNVWHKVAPETVGQYTGLRDKNEKEIYEGDILRDEHTQKIRAVEYNSPSFVLVDSNRYFFWNCHYDEQEVIGNIYENPELMEV